MQEWRVQHSSAPIPSFNMIKKSLKIMCFHIPWQTLISFCDRIECHESRISSADHMYLLLTVLPIISLSLHFSKINVLYFLSIFLTYLYVIIYLPIKKFLTFNLILYTILLRLSIYLCCSIRQANSFSSISVLRYSLFLLCPLPFSRPLFWTGCKNYFKYFEPRHVYMCNITHSNSQRTKPWSEIYIWCWFYF